ncbi:DUF6350 family protein [Kineosporia mesophila]|uniref:DUF6350 family protein n=1 Tax=Kineosporia mesophila TaxID=566012 RepID=A0ABP6ZRC8_9ACTN|nr:DUF6350 family protein [Kineosporia mesophila]MCD5349913.1 DUF6350 family protein [Kineosporia mesophila]
MSTVRDQIGTPTGTVVRGPGRRPNVVLYAAVVAAQAAAASLAVVMVPVVLAWATASYSKAPWTDVVQFGIGAWLLAHHVGIVIPDGHLGLVPLGLMLVPVMSCWFGGVRLARGLDPNADAIREGIGRARPKAPTPKAMGVFVFSYAGIVTAVAALSTQPAVRPLLGQAFAGSMAIVCLSGAAGMAAWVGGGVVPGLRLMVDKTRSPKVIRRCLRPVLLGVCVQLVAALILLLVAGGLGWSRMVTLHNALGTGLVGGAVLVLAQLLVVPNLMVWAASYATGAGFSVGSGTTVAPGQLDVGTLPALPVLGALPAGPGSQLLWLLVAIPAVGGVVTGVRVLRMPLGRNFLHLDASSTRQMIERVPHHVRVPLVRSVVATVLMTLVWTLLGWLAGGAAGPGRLGTMGPDVPVFVLWTALESGAAIVLTVAVGLGVRALAGDSSQPDRSQPAGVPRPASSASLSGAARDPLEWLDRPGPPS